MSQTSPNWGYLQHIFEGDVENPQILGHLPTPVLEHLMEHLGMHSSLMLVLLGDTAVQ